MVPELKWNPENGYKDMKVVVELGDEIDAKKACERQLRQKYKSLGALKIVIDRGLQVTECTCALVLLVMSLTHRIIKNCAGGRSCSH